MPSWERFRRASSRNRVQSAIRSLLVVTAVASTAAIAGLTEGLDALRRNDYATASKELRPLAEKGNAEAQYRVGLMYEFGKGFPQDSKQAAGWFRKSGSQGHAAAQMELGVMYANGDGVPVDNAQAVAWFRKAADQGFDIAQFYLGVAHENGEGVAKDGVLAYAYYAISARSGNQDYRAHRDDVGKTLTPAQLREAQSLAQSWEAGKPMPVRVAATGTTAAATTWAARAPDKCSATGAMEGERFAATHCAVSLYGDAHSVAIWFNEDAISPAESEAFQTSSYADGAKGGKPRTMAIVMFCPGGGTATASAAAVRSIDLNTSHAKSPLAGIQWVVEAPHDFRVEKLSGEVQPGAALRGRIVGARGKTTWTFDFDVTLPAKDAAAGMSCK